MWQNSIVMLIVGSAVAYLGWNIYRGIVSAANACEGGGCDGCGGRKSGVPENLVQLTTEPSEPSPSDSPDKPAQVSSGKS